MSLEAHYFVILLSVAFLHSLIPSHWLCFSLIARSFEWSARTLFFVVTIANFFHTVFLLLVILVFRFILPKFLGSYLSPLIILLLGVMYVSFHYTGAGHRHESDRAVERGSVWLLITSLLISPCNYIFGIVASVADISIASILLITGLMLLVSTLTMFALSYLSLLGLKSLKLEWFDRNEKWIIGAVMIGISILLFIHEQR